MVILMGLINVFELVWWLGTGVYALNKMRHWPLFGLGTIIGFGIVILNAHRAYVLLQGHAALDAANLTTISLYFSSELIEVFVWCFIFGSYRYWARHSHPTGPHDYRQDPFI